MQTIVCKTCPIKNNILSEGGEGAKLLLGGGVIVSFMLAKVFTLFVSSVIDKRTFVEASSLHK